MSTLIINWLRKWKMAKISAISWQFEKDETIRYAGCYVIGMAYATARILHLAVSDVSGDVRINKGTLKRKKHTTNTKDRKNQANKKDKWRYAMVNRKKYW